MFKLSRLFTASIFALAIGVQAIESPANAAPLAVPSPASSLIAYTNTSSLTNLMIEYRKATTELAQLDRDVKSATSMFNRLTAELDRLTQPQALTPEAKAILAQRVDLLVQERKQQQDKMNFAIGMREQVVSRLASINAERGNMKASLTNDLKNLTTEINFIKDKLRALN